MVIDFGAVPDVKGFIGNNSQRVVAGRAYNQGLWYDERAAMFFYSVLEQPVWAVKISTVSGCSATHEAWLENRRERFGNSSFPMPAKPGLAGLIDGVGDYGSFPEYSLCGGCQRGEYGRSRARGYAGRE